MFPIPEVTLSDFDVKVPVEEGEVTVRAMEVHPDRTQTTEKLVTMQVKEHKICWQESACLLAMVLERHGKNGNIGYGFLTGFVSKRGNRSNYIFS